MTYPVTAGLDVGLDSLSVAAGSLTLGSGEVDSRGVGDAAGDPLFDSGSSSPHPLTNAAQARTVSTTTPRRTEENFEVIMTTSLVGLTRP